MDTPFSKEAKYLESVYSYIPSSQISVRINYNMGYINHIPVLFVPCAFSLFKLVITTNQRCTHMSEKPMCDAPAKNIFLQAVLSFKLKVLSKTKKLQSLICPFYSSLRLFAVASCVRIVDDEPANIHILSNTLKGYEIFRFCG